jgi:oligopeptidase B
VFFGKVGDENRGSEPMNPPKVVFDPYFWLRDDERKDPKVIAHLKAENDYCEFMTKHLKTHEADLYKELLSHVKETDEAVPYPNGNFFYYSKTIKGLSYRVYCRKAAEPGSATVASPHDLSAPEEIMLDMNEEAKGKSHCDLGAYQPSPDHSLLAYSLDVTGYETFTIYIKDVATGKVLEDQIPGTYPMKRLIKTLLNTLFVTFQFIKCRSNTQKHTHTHRK